MPSDIEAPLHPDLQSACEPQLTDQNRGCEIGCSSKCSEEGRSNDAVVREQSARPSTSKETVKPSGALPRVVDNRNYSSGTMVQLFGNSVLAETPGPGLASYQWPWSTSTDDLPPVDYQHDYSVQSLWVSSQTPAATTYFHPVSLFPPPIVFGMPPPQPLPPLPQQPPLLLPLGKPTTLGLVGTEPVVASGPPSLSASSDGSRDFAQMTPILKDSPPPPVELPVSKQLQKVWHGQFSKLFDQFQPDLWQLMPLGQNEPPAESQGWYFFKDSAKVRFECTACSHCWTSMKGRVCFWFSRYDVCDGAQLRREGVVIFKLFGQACNKCNGEQIYHAMWYPEEVEKVITNIYHRVGQVFYNFVAPPLLLARRRGRPRLQHNSERCEACKMGVCQQEWEFR